jgi:carbonic anhydrase/acetyltransferase-like protein (isoleucine patch superfamily)
MPVFSVFDQAPEMPPPDQCYVAETAIVIGRVRIKAGVSLWFGAVLRGDNEWIEIGERTNIQDNCTLHTDPGFPLTVGSGVTVCLIGNNTLIGMGAVVMNGAQVGSNCIVGAGALVAEKAVVPDNALVVGSPARKIRDNDDATIKLLIEYSAEVYFNRWQAYAESFKRIG